MLISMSMIVLKMCGVFCLFGGFAGAIPTAIREASGSTLEAAIPGKNQNTRQTPKTTRQKKKMTYVYIYILTTTKTNALRKGYLADILPLEAVFVRLFCVPVYPMFIINIFCCSLLFILLFGFLGVLGSDKVMAILN